MSTELLEASIDDRCREARQSTLPDAARKMEELGHIIQTYSQLTENLRESHRQLTCTVQLLREELGQKNRLLERKQRLAALGEMAAGLAHEIRNPLGGIHLYASMLADDVADRPASLRTVSKISAGVHRLESLVGQVLQFAREVVISPQTFDLGIVVEQAAEDAASKMIDRGVECRIEGQRPMPVHVDPLLLGQVVLNLLLNAAEASGPGGIIFVGYRRVDQPDSTRQFELSVRDMGPGINPAILEKIFNPFFTTRENGTGLGLAIVHRIVEAHEGTIIAANDPAGGAVFEIRI